MKKMLVLVVLVAAAFTLAIAPAAFADTTGAIISDAQDGHIDGNWTDAQLQAALSSPLLKEYAGKGGVEAVESALGSQTDASSPSGNLPFTGAEMVTFVLIGGALVITGFVLRRTGRPDDTP
jgi:hypothetical protein